MRAQRSAIATAVAAALVVVSFLPRGAEASADCGRVGATGEQRLTVIAEGIRCRPARRVITTYFRLVRDGACAGGDCSARRFDCVRNERPDAPGTRPNVTCGRGNARVYADDFS